MKKIIPIHDTGDAWIASDKIHARAISGNFARWRWFFVWATQAVFYGIPWLNWNGRQAVLFDLQARRFFLFDAVLFPQDLIYLAALLVVSALLLFFATAVAGRVWCGFACPQTVYTSIFMWIENRFEGSHQNRKRLDAMSWGPEKLARRGGKHLAWAAFGLWTGLTFVGYFTAIRPLVGDLLSLSAGPWTTFWVCFYGLFTYLNAGLVREKVCLHMCPYGRFQGSLMDERTLNVAYDHRRGEPRRGALADDHRSNSDGHCIDCTLCVQVCPTGIDIRQGLQAACIGCGLCIDACNQVMDKIHAPRGLIRMASLQELSDRTSARLVPLWRQLLRPRVIIYGSLLLAVSVALSAAFSHRPEVRLNVVRDRTVMARQVDHGAVENVYLLQLMNASDHGQLVTVTAHPANELQLIKNTTVTLEPAQATTFPVTVRMPNTVAVSRAGDILPIHFEVRQVGDTSQLLMKEASTFIVPR